MKHFNIYVEGKVQGVWFRKNTLKKAVSLGLKGFVRNEDNGDVYVEIEGNEPELLEFILWCNKGPENAKVTGLQIKQSEMTGFQSFEIK